MSSGIVHREAELGDIRLHYAEAGAGPLVLLVHGFPEFWYCWREQIPRLAEAGYRVVAPDMRGYNLSGKPRGRHAYFIRELVADMAALIEHCGEESAAVAGHDWGGIVAWYLAARRPALVRRLALLNAPPPPSAGRELRSWEQRRRSLYVLFFALPFLPERMLAAGDMRAIERLFTSEPRRPFSPEDIKLYKRALSEKGALTAMINYYRAVFARENRRDLLEHGHIKAPALVIWGDRDRHMVPAMTDGLDDFFDELRIEHLAEATHWVHHDEPERVARLLAEHFSAERAPA